MSLVFWHLYHAITGKGKSVHNAELIKKTTSNLCLSVFFYLRERCAQRIRFAVVISGRCRETTKKERRNLRTALQPCPTSRVLCPIRYKIAFTTETGLAGELPSRWDKSHRRIAAIRGLYLDKYWKIIHFKMPVCISWKDLKYAGLQTRNRVQPGNKA